MLTHTQVLDRDVALLVRPEPGAFASAIVSLIDNPRRRQQLADAAMARARERYSREVYVTRTRLVCERLAVADATDSARR